MKTIYLKNKEGLYTEYIYSDINSLNKIITDNKIDIQIGSNVQIGSFVEIDSDVDIGLGVNIGSGVIIGSDYDIKTGNPLYIIGSVHIVCNYTNNKIQIGCLINTFDYWLKNYERIGIIEGYTFEEIKEYKTYIDFIINKYKQKN